MKDRDDIISVSLSQYTTPCITENKQGDYVEYGEDNDYFNYLIERVTGSTTNGAIVNGISNLIYGKGLSATNAEGDNVAEWTKVMTLFRPSDLRKVIYDRKALGMAAFQVIYDKDKVVGVEHFPIQTLRPEKKNDKGEIEVWYYHPNWVEKKRNEDPEPIAAFGFGNGKEPEIYIWQDYMSGHEYFTPPDYIGAVPYALLEAEIADYLINDTQNGFSPTTIVNYNNGVPEDQDKRRKLAYEGERKITGSKGKKVIISFNDDKESATTIDSIPLNDAPQHYEYLSKECFNKLIVGHRVTSPMLLGIRDGQSGLGNNADEIKNATLLFENIVIRVYQNQLIDCIKEIYPTNLDLYFKTIQPLEFMQVDEPLSEDEEEKQTGVELSKVDERIIDTIIADDLVSKGEELSDEWELVDDRDVDDDLEDEMDELVKEADKQSRTVLQKAVQLVSTGTARPNSKSDQDKTIDGVNYKVRYKYSPERVSQNSREFCRKMVAANKLYRKEDITAMDNKVVNAGFGVNGADTYSIWKYKGGARCSHKWRRQTFKKRGSIDVKSPLAPKVSTNKAEREGYRIRNPREVAMKPKDMPNNGFKNPQ